MKKSELKKHLVEALTPDEAAKVEPKYKETYAAMIRGKGPLKLKKYDNPDKVVRGRVVNTIKNESLKLAEKLGKDADLGDHIEDFTKSDAKQFQGKSKKKIRQMATAAFLNKEEQKLDEIDAIMEKEEDKLPANDIKKAIRALLKKEGGAAGLAPILKLAKDFNGVTQIDVEDILDNDMKDVEKHRDGDYILKETGLKKSEENMDDYKRLNELVKAALMRPISEKKFPDLNDDGKITKADVLIGRGVKLKEEEEDEKEFVAINAIIADLNDKVPQFKTIDTPDEYLALLDRIVTILVKESPSFVGSGRFITANVEFYNRRKDYNAKAKAQGEKVEEGKVDESKLAPLLSILKTKPEEAGKEIAKVLGNETDKLINLFIGMGADEKKAREMAKNPGRALGVRSESFKSLSKDIDKQKGKTKEDGDNIAGFIANIKRTGGGKGPTAKQKKRMAETILKELRG
jgi:hypothetical protein